MKKLFLTLAATALCTTAFAGTRVLYQQNFDQAVNAAATGWTYGGGSMTIASDEYGKFLELALGQNNGRSGQCTWGTEIYQDENGATLLEDGKYYMSFDFSIKTMSNNQYNSEITVFTNHAPIANNTYRTPWTKPLGPWDNFLFDMSQTNTTADADMTATVDAPLVATTAEDGTVSYALATEPSYTFMTGNWFTVELNVDVNARTVDYRVANYTGDEVTSGTLNVPEKNVAAAEDEDPISMLAEGLFVMTARYQTTIDIDNIMISIDTTYDWANAPAIALTGLGKDENDELNLNMRTYTITFMDGETLHVVDPSGAETTVEYADCDGAYVYSTSTSGTLKAYTTSGTATSEVVEETVDCTPVVLPEATATISAVEAGYGKTYTLTVSNADVPLMPTIFINYEFKGDNGESIVVKEAASGATVEVHEAGTLTLTTEAFGYQSTTVNVKNNLEFAVKQEWDFARMSDEEIAAAGFTDWQVLNSSKTSGFNNWTARKRLYYYDGTTYTDEEGNEKETQIYPFGFIAEDNEVNVLHYSEIGVDSKTAEEHNPGINVEGYELFPGIEVFAGHNVTYLKHIGMINNSTDNGNDKNIVVKDLDATDFVVVNKINDYGSSSIHPTCATDEEYYAQLTGTLNDVYVVAEVGTEVMEGEGDAAVASGKYTVTCPIYRIDTAATCVTVYKQIGDAVEGVAAEVAGDNYYYTIDGIRLAQPTQKGLYIHNGKKVIVK